VSANNKILRTPPGFWTGQSLHIVCVSILLITIFLYWDYSGAHHPTAFWVAVSVPVLHQVFVWIAWRLELKSSAVSKTIGFHGYLVIFFLLFTARFLSLVILAWLDRESLGLEFTPRAIIAALFLGIGMYAMYSVKQYFGFARAAGGDHFETRYRKMPLVKQGIFRYTKNGMYLFAFLIFWAIAVVFNSSAALVVAAFSHIYIWVHYFASEKPDMEYLYND